MCTQYAARRCQHPETNNATNRRFSAAHLTWAFVHFAFVFVWLGHLTPPGSLITHLENCLLLRRYVRRVELTPPKFYQNTAPPRCARWCLLFIFELRHLKIAVLKWGFRVPFCFEALYAPGASAQRQSAVPERERARARARASALPHQAEKAASLAYATPRPPLGHVNFGGW